MKNSASSAVILVLVMLFIVLAALFWFLYLDYDAMRQQAALSDSRATRAATLEQEAGQIRGEADSISATRAALVGELATAVSNQDLLAQEAVNDQQTIQLLETRTATQTAVIEQNLILQITNIPVVQILAPASGDVAPLSEAVDLVVSAMDASGLATISIVFDGNPPLEIPAGGETSILIQEPWPLSEAGSHTAVVTAVNSSNISSQAVSVTITAETALTNQQIANEVANIIGLPETTVINEEQANSTAVYTVTTSLILQAFGLQTDETPENAWGTYCQPASDSFISAAETNGDSPAKELAQVRALTREWQETRFQLSSLLAVAPSDDARAALCALAAGHERWVLTEYIRRAPVDRQGLLAENLTPQNGLVSSDALTAQQNFGALYGPAFVNALVDLAGPTAVVEAWNRPPQSSAHILHPELYQNETAPAVVTLPDLAASLGTDWTTVTENVLGEFMLGQVLKNNVAGEMAETAVSGWNGDRYGIYQQGADGSPLLVLQINWTEPAQAERFAEVYEMVVNGRLANPALLPASPANTACWAAAAGETICLFTTDTTTIIVSAPDSDLASTALAEVTGN
ncbi:MAG: hypothetical protein R6X34_16175 [Chloroflexota bacterium]